MDYDNCSTVGTFVPGGLKNIELGLTYNCNQSDVYDWLSDIATPPSYKVCDIIEIKFKGNRKEFYLNHQNLYLERGELVVVAGTMGGYDIGHVSLTGELVRMQLKKKNVRIDEVIKQIYRRAAPADVSKWKLAKEMDLDTMHKVHMAIKVTPCQRCKLTPQS